MQSLSPHTHTQKKLELRPRNYRTPDHWWHSRHEKNNNFSQTMATNWLLCVTSKSGSHIKVFTKQLLGELNYKWDSILLLLLPFHPAQLDTRFNNFCSSSSTLPDIKFQLFSQVILFLLPSFFKSSVMTMFRRSRFA